MTSATVELPYLPKSLNTLQHAHWRTVYRAKQSLQDDLAALLLEAKVPRPVPGDSVRVDLVFVVPDKRRRDLINFAAPLDKALGDTCQAIGLIGDDTPAQYVVGSSRFEYVKGVRATRIELSW